MKKIKGSRPTCIEELSSALASATDETRLIAGGTDLIIKMNQMTTNIDHLITLNHVQEMSQIFMEKDHLYIGGNLTFDELENDALVNEYIPALAAAASMVGSPQIRNRATIAGNVANASPCGDSIAPMMIYDAQVQILNGAGQISEKPIEEVVIGPEVNSLQSNEVITGFHIPIKPSAFISHFVKLGAKKTVTIAKINMAVGFEIDKVTNTIMTPRVAMGAVGRTAKRFPEIEAIIDQQLISQNLKLKFSAALSAAIEKAIGDRPSMPYKREAVKGLADDILNYWPAFNH